MVHGMRKAAEQGFRLIGTVHDEIIALYHKVLRRKPLVKWFESLICEMPDWAIGDSLETTIPLTAEGVISVRYGK